jgi:hypothetical protein
MISEWRVIEEQLGNNLVVMNGSSMNVALVSALMNVLVHCAGACSAREFAR